MRNLNKKRTRSTSRRTTSSKRVKYANVPTVVKPGTIVKMKYTDLITLSNFAVGQDYHTFRAASIFDPDLTGSGHQPLGHDQWAQLYQRYRVLGCKMKVTFINQSSTITEAEHVGMCVAETSGLALARDMAEQTKTRQSLIGPTGNQSWTGTLYVDLARFEGDPGAKYDKDYSADMGTNPVRDIFFYIWAQDLNADDSVEVTALVELEYTVRLYDRIDLTRS
jgi:hypothetical protein